MQKYRKTYQIKLLLKQTQKNFIFFIDKYSVNKYIKELEKNMSETLVENCTPDAQPLHSVRLHSNLYIEIVK